MMYAALWRALPGPWPARLVLVLVLLAVTAYLLVFHVYPWVMQSFFPTPDPTFAGSDRRASAPA